jgi:Fe-S oxidoreductase
MWDASKCDLCGDCLVQCRYVDYDKDKAESEMKLLMEGKAADILSSCITCNACYEVCPTGADPVDLIGKMQEKIGSPIAEYSKPFLEGLAKVLEEGNGDSEFIEGHPDKPVLSFDSFEFKLFPKGTLDSKLFEGMSVVRGSQYMSLVGLVHMGGASFAEKYARKVIDRFAKLGKDIVYIHNEGYALAHLKSKELGIEVPYNYVHLFDYLRKFFRTHQQNITKLNKKIAYQTNCANRWLPEQDGWLNEILGLIGVQRVERKYEGKNALCCSAPIIRTNKTLAVRIQEDNVRDAINSGADAMVTICPMCDWALRRPTSELGLPKIFITDLCRMAIGEVAWPGNETKSA